MQEGCDSYQSWSRRAILRGAALGGVAWMAGIPSALANLGFRAQPDGRDTLVVVFLRGGADGLNVVPPYLDDDYHRRRPSLRLRSPKESAAGTKTLDLDGFFGLHPSMAGLYPLYREGKMAVIQAVGSADQTRSHFEAMSAMERGLARLGPGSDTSNGWLARYLNHTAQEGDSPLRAVAIGDLMPDSLRGGLSAMALPDLGAFRLRGDRAFRERLTEAYGSGDDAIATAGRETLRVLDTLNRLDYAGYRPTAPAAYPSSDLGNALKQVAFLLKAEVGLEVAFLDKGGWDTHVAQGSTTGWLAGLLEDVGNSLAAFTADIGPRLGKTTVVVMTEFGRRVYENSGLGTDHGRASCMFVMGGSTRGGKVYGDWPTLADDKLEGTGDLRVTTDYRDVLGEVLTRRMGLDQIDTVFPGLRHRPLGLLG